MRAFIWVSAGLGVAVVLAFALAMLRDRPDAPTVLPSSLVAGQELSGSAADDAFRAWSTSLPPAPTPLTTRYELRAEYRDEETGAMRAELDLGILNGSGGLLRLDIHARSADGDSALETVVEGALVIDGAYFWAWGSLPIEEEYEALARGKVVRLPLELLSLFFREGLRWLGDAGLPLPSGVDPSAELRITEWLHPARVSSLLARGASVTQMTLEGDTLQVTVTGASSALALMSRILGDAPGLSTAELPPLKLAFDADTGELRSAELALAEDQGFFRIVAASRERSAPASSFRHPDDLQVFDLALPVQIALKMLRQARPAASEEEY